MRKKTKLVLSLILAFVLACTFATSAFADDSSETSAEATEARVIKCGLPSPEGSPHFVAVSYMNEYLEKNGLIKIEIYPSNALGNERELPESVGMGTVDMGVITCSVLANYSGSYYMLDLPYMVSDRGNALEVLNGEAGRELMKTLEPAGIYQLGFWDQGFRQFENNVRECKTVEDVKGLKIRIIENDMFKAMFTNVGVLPTVMDAAEVLTGLEQGTIDGLDVALSAVYSAGYYVGLKHILVTNHVYSTMAPIMNLDLWNSLTPEEQEDLAGAMEYSVDKMIEYMDKADADCLERFEKEGGTVNYADKEEWAELMQPVWDMYMDKIDPDLFELIHGAFDKAM